ncbi:hypothetical protein AVEN_199392-1 [Araneus ventricosus]|uniref:BTB domain-containing protein n=1 Tax=Araneus ventricosus TaxID=182803 RepID=A0A4Y2BT69_ARAVE|nr:hypothetical protein AVEN_199392-1 [Araneus ventricosus]
MFTKNMKEKTAKYVDISDISADTLRRLLLYIYTNIVDELQWEDASDLFRAADKYELLDLRAKCSYFLKAKLSSSNACGILVLADMHHDENLLQAAQDFISQDSEIFYSDAWRNLKE